MKILSIDYGVSTGLALCSLEGSDLIKLYLGTINSAALFKSSYPVPEDCECIVLEQAPFGATWSTSVIFHTLFADLQKSGFVLSDTLQEKGIVLVAPSQWKPFVKRQNLDLRSWSPKTKHERDAMCMLWYAVSMQNKKEKYVFK